MRIGFMQGRLVPPVDGKIQAFPKDDWELEFERAGAAGFPLIEWTLDQDGLHQNPLMTGSGQRRIADLCARHGIRVASITGDCFMQAPFWKADDAGRADLLSDFAAIIDAASAVGTHLIVVPLVDDGAVETDGQMNVLMQGMSALEDRLRAKNVAITFEIDFEPGEVRAFIDRFDPCLFGINYDIGNSVALGYDPAEEIAAYGDRITNVHVKDRPRGGITVPLTTGDADLPGVTRLIVETGFDGNWILQTARAADGDDVGAAARYRDMVAQWLSEAGAG